LSKLLHVYGAGPAGLIAAEVLAQAGQRVVIHDHMASPGRKFLLAGRGGLNLTHSEPLEKFLHRYGDARTRLEPAIRAFPPEAVREWCQGLGIETFVGTSGRIFPRNMKASPLLRAWLRRLDGLGVTLESRSPWPGFESGPVILAFGGASWPHLGSNASWVPSFAQAGIEVVQFRPVNGRQRVAWSEHFASRFAGQPLKNISVAYGAKAIHGEALISKDGIEGSAIYALTGEMLNTPGLPLIIDLRPDLSLQDVEAKYGNKRSKESTSNFLRKAFALSPAAVGLMRETHATSPKQVIVQIEGPSAIDRAISSAGGVAWHEVDGQFQLIKKPSVFVAGEMLDWHAPTGGYLLQACFSTGVAAAKGLLASL
jgi:uncharacterized flavoprotein (TIGR03862 family)